MNNKIYFLGRKQGYSVHKYLPTKIENLRPYEAKGLQLAKCIDRTHFINNANILFFRNKPEKTTDKQISQLIKRISKHKDKLIINDINSFYNYDSKDRAFKIWKDNKLFCPDFISFEHEEINNHTDIAIEKVKEFFKKNKKIILRTNNDTGSKSLFVIEDINEIEKIFNKLIFIVNEKINFFKDSKIICVQYIELNTENNYNELYRVHVLFDNILSYYVATSKKKQFHQADMTINDLDRFIEVNHNFKKILPTIKQELIQAVKLLGNNIGGIEFFLIDNKPCFIELNPMWGGAAGRGGFGDEEMKKYINTNKDKLYNKISNIYDWLDYDKYYCKMFQKINEFYNEKFIS